jgi:mRNA interferase HigB
VSVGRNGVSLTRSDPCAVAIWYAFGERGITKNSSPWREDDFYLISDRIQHAGENFLEAWHQEVARADWASPSVVKTHFLSASVQQENRVVFNIGGNQYRLVVKINYPYRVVYIRFIGTHRDYDAIDVATI